MSRKDTIEISPDLPKTLMRALDGAGIHHLEHLTRMSESELLRLHGMGSKALGMLRDALAANSQSFAKEEK
ncbi:hypothetical protein BH24ACT21_BH24ACT21_04250 [soil metagenome]|jgi:DNA-directed RNA polymerase alpha subunit